MQSTVKVRGVPLSRRNSVCLSVCPSVRHVPVLCPNERDTIVRFLASGRRITLVSEEIKFIQIIPDICRGSLPARALK